MVALGPYAERARRLFVHKLYCFVREAAFRTRQHDEVEAVFRALGSELSVRG